MVCGIWVLYDGLTLRSLNYRSLVCPLDAVGLQALIATWVLCWEMMSTHDKKTSTSMVVYWAIAAILAILAILNKSVVEIPGHGKEWQQVLGGNATGLLRLCYFAAIGDVTTAQYLLDQASIGGPKSTVFALQENLEVIKRTLLYCLNSII